MTANDASTATAAPAGRLSVEVEVEIDGDNDEVPKPGEFRRWVTAACAEAGLEGAAEVSVLLVGAERGAALNRDYRGRDRATNVLSFPGDPLPEGDGGPPYLLGDVVLAQGVCAREAAAQGKALADHLSHLVVHGVLHLLGHDHENDSEAERMESLEVEILAALGVADPYASERAANARRAGAPGR